MVTATAPSRLTAKERARRAARGGASRSVPAPLLAPALIAVGFLVLPLAGLLIRAPWDRIGAAQHGERSTTGGALPSSSGRGRPRRSICEVASPIAAM